MDEIVEVQVWVRVRDTWRIAAIQFDPLAES